MEFGRYQLRNNVIAAPMAGVTDRAFRQLCLKWGAGLAVSEMVASNPLLRTTAKSRRRIEHVAEAEPRSVQIVGADPEQMAQAARYNVALGAQIIDINMGCPAKKVCKTNAGSALLHDEKLVARILDSVVAAVDAPVTLKMRTGPEPQRRNGVAIACLAERAGIKALSVHGRTRACKFRGTAEYLTIRDIKRAVSIPVIANGDIDSPHKTRQVLDFTGADGVMIGRAAQGRPWLFGQIGEYLRTGRELANPPLEAQRDTMLAHLENLYSLYGGEAGVRIARKHINWYTRAMNGGEEFWHYVNRLEEPRRQQQAVRQHFDQQLETQAA